MGLSNLPIHRLVRAARLGATSDHVRSIGEKRLQLALEAAGLGEWEVDLLGGRSTWSLRARQILALPAVGAVSAEQIAAGVHPDDRTRFTAAWESAGATPGNHACEFRVLRPESAPRWVLLRGRTTFGTNGNANEPALRVGTVLDVTPRKTAEEALRSSQSLLAEAERIAHLGAFEWELPSRKAIWTDEVFRIVGLEPGAIQPTVETMLSHVHVEDRVELTRLVERCIETGEPFSWRFRVIRPDGSGRVALRQGHMVRGPTGIPLRIVGTVQDVTDESIDEERRQVSSEKALKAQSLQSLAVLSGGIAHDFNNILCAVIGNLDIALGDLPEESPVREALDRAKAAGHRAAALSAQMLAYSGRGQFVVERVDLNSVVDVMAGLLRSSVPASAAVLLDLGSDLPRIDADVAQLRQLLSNLVLNAAEALPATGGTIRIRSHRLVVDDAFRATAFEAEALEDGPHLCLEISDDGHGMDAETKARVFEPFFTTRFTGRGLGMAVVLGIVRGHKGAVRIATAPGQGTTVRIVLPFAAPARLAPSDVARATRAPGGSGAGALVLVVDDEPMVLAVTGRILEREGYQVVTTDDGAAGLRVFEERRADIRAVLLDLTMPGLGGREVLRAIRRIDPDVPVLLVSGYSEQEATAGFAGMGLTGFVAKPFDAVRLVEALEAVIAGAHRRHADRAA